MNDVTVHATRICRKCGQKRPIERFPRAVPSRPCGTKTCRDCINAQSRERYAKPRVPRATLAERFWAKVDKRGADECWPWTASRNNTGYGMVGIRSGRYALSHRVAWELEHGAPAGELCVCHRCDNPPCCNPRHLFIGTISDNNADKMSKGRHVSPRGEEHHRARLTQTDVVAIRQLSLSGVRSSEIARKFAITRLHVNAIVRRSVWRHVL